MPIIDLPFCGKKIAYGEVTPASATHTVVTGLAFVESCVASFVGDPTITMMYVGANKGNQTGTPAAGSIIIESTKPTDPAGADSDAAPIASTTPRGSVTWLAIGR